MAKQIVGMKTTFSVKTNKKQMRKALEIARGAAQSFIVAIENNHEYSLLLFLGLGPAMHSDDIGGVTYSYLHT